MLLTAKKLKRNEYFPVILQNASELVAIYNENPDLGSIMASQRRWLLAHSGFALFLGYPGHSTPALYSSRFIEFTQRHNIASHNTATAFLKEMTAYKFLRPACESPNRRITLLEPTEIAREYMAKWIHTHLLVLDTLDGGDRMAKVAVDAEAVWRMHPVIVAKILNNRIFRHPGTTFGLFNSATSGES
jgi:hypothetical protein